MGGVGIGMRDGDPPNARCGAMLGRSLATGVFAHLLTGKPSFSACDAGWGQFWR
jgi:hypothetical protein